MAGSESQAVHASPYQICALVETALGWAYIQGQLQASLDRGALQELL
jgi:hypothetical protein